MENWNGPGWTKDGVFRRRLVVRVVHFGVVLMMDVGKTVVRLDEGKSKLLAEPVRGPQAGAASGRRVLALAVEGEGVLGDYKVARRDLWEGDVGVRRGEAEAEMVDLDLARGHGGRDHHDADRACARLQSCQTQTRQDDRERRELHVDGVLEDDGGRVRWGWVLDVAGWWWCCAALN